jgi:hypothetical protein
MSGRPLITHHAFTYPMIWKFTGCVRKIKKRSADTEVYNQELFDRTRSRSLKLSIRRYPERLRYPMQ